MGKAIKASCVAILLFIYLFPFRFIGWTLSLNDVEVLFFLFFSFVVLLKKINIGTQSISNILIAVIFFILYIVSISIFNNSYDVTIYKSVLFSFIISPLVAFGIVKFFALNEKNIIFFFTIVLIIQSWIALVLFLNESISLFFLNAIDLSYQNIDAPFISEHRLFGLGTEYFGMGTIYGYGLICIVKYIGRYSDSIWLYFGYLTVLIVGIFGSRTTIIGFILSLFLMNINIIRKFSSVIIVAILIGLVATLILGIDLSDSKILNHTFEFANNYLDTGEFSSSSTDELIQMYNSSFAPESYLFGDAHLNNADGSYYGRTDVGYFRQVYAYGFVGVLIVYFIYYDSIRRISSKSRDADLFAILTLFYYFILNFKGLSFHALPVDKMVLLLLFATNINPLAYGKSK